MYMLILSLIHSLACASGSYFYFPTCQNWDLEFSIEPSLSPALPIFSNGNSTISLSRVRNMSYS